MHRYRCYNGPMPTTAAQLPVVIGVIIKTMLQLATPATRQIQLIAWGYSLNDSTGTDGTIELLETDVAATVTAHVASGVQPLVPGQPASLLTLGVSATGYSATAEGTPTATRVFDVVNVTESATLNATTIHYSYQWMPDERPIVAVSKFLRVRATTPTSGTDMTTWVVWDE